MSVCWKSGRWLGAVTIIVTLSLLAPMVASCSPKPAEAAKLPPAPLIGRTAPDFALKDLDGNAVRLSDFHGKTVFLNFFATWCVSCQKEMPALEQTYLDTKDKNVVILGIDLAEPPDTVRTYMSNTTYLDRNHIIQKGYGWRIAIDTTQQVTTDYHVTGIPTSFFIDQAGVIQGLYTGPMSTVAMERMINLFASQ
jgi:peroxiredoxin